MKQNNNNMSDFPEKIGSADGMETAIIIKRGIRHTEAVLRVQQQQQWLFGWFDVCDCSSAYININFEYRFLIF